MPLFRRIVDYKEAVQWNGNNVEELTRFGGPHIEVSSPGMARAGKPPVVVVHTPTGPANPAVGDWIAKQSENDFYPIKDEVFRTIYVPANGNPSLSLSEEQSEPQLTDLSFGTALSLLKEGRRVARAGWNGKGMWLALSPGTADLPAEKFWAGPNREYAQKNGGTATVLPCITMKVATGEILMGWLASQTDMLATDWEIVTE